MAKKVTCQRIVPIIVFAIMITDRSANPCYGDFPIFKKQMKTNVHLFKLTIKRILNQSETESETKKLFIHNLCEKVDECRAVMGKL